MIKYFDIFAGIGGFRSGLEKAGGFECVGYCEIDKYARLSYETLYDTEREVYYDDARKIDPNKLPDFDLICGGFPCQSFSIAGKRGGFDDARGTLFFEIARIAAVKKPKYLLLENVPGLLSHDQGRTFAAILSSLDELGYDVAWQVLNSADFHVAQSRKRVFIVGFLREKCSGKVLSFTDANPKTLVQRIPGREGCRVYSADGLSITLTPNTADLQYQLAYGTINIWNFLDDLQKYGQYADGNALSGTEDNVITYNLSIPSAESAFSLTAGTGWTKSDEVFYVKNVDFYNANDELLYTYTGQSVGVGDIRKLTSAIERAEAIDLSKYTADSAERLALITEDAKAILNNSAATKPDYTLHIKELEDAIAGLELLMVTGNVTGTINVSDKETKTEMTVTAVAADGTKTSVTATSMGTYVFENLEVGDYTLTVSGGKYAERTYEITVKASDNTQDVKLNPYGDINGDGNVTTADVGMANSHAKGVRTLTDYDFACGDVNRDGSITTADVGMINSHAKGVKSLW